MPAWLIANTGIQPTFDDVGGKALWREVDVQAKSEEGETLVASLLTLQKLDHETVES